MNYENDVKTKKKLMKTLKFTTNILILGIILLFTGCSDDDVLVSEPTSEDAAFKFVFDSDNPNKVNFNATPK